MMKDVSLRGIYATTAVFTQYFISDMVVQSLGIEEFDTETWVLGTVASLVESAPLAGPLGRRFGSRAVVMVAGCLICGGLVCTSQASDVMQIALYLTLMIAVGQCLANILTRSSLGEHFDVREFAVASAIGRIGFSLGLICLPPLVQLFHNMYGWRGALLLVGSIGAHTAVSGALLKPVPKSSKARAGYQSLPDSSCQPQPFCKPDRHVLASVKCFFAHFDLPLMKNLNFWAISVTFATTRICKSSWYIYFVPRAISIGFSIEMATVMVSVAAMFQLVIVIMESIVLYREKVTSTSLMTASVLLVAVSFLITPLTTSWWAVWANAALFVSSMGMVFNLVDVMVKELLGVDKMAGAFGWMGFLSGVTRPLSGFIPGWLYDHTGSYNTAFLLLGVIQITALIPLLIRRLKT